MSLVFWYCSNAIGIAGVVEVNAWQSSSCLVKNTQLVLCRGRSVGKFLSTTLRYQLQQPVHALHFLCSCLNSGHFGIIRTLWEQPHKTQPSNNWVALSSLVRCLSLSSRIHNISTLSITSTLCSFTPYKLYIFSKDMILAVRHHHHIQKARKIQHMLYFCERMIILLNRIWVSQGCAI